MYTSLPALRKMMFLKTADMAGQMKQHLCGTNLEAERGSLS